MKHKFTGFQVAPQTNDSQRSAEIGIDSRGLRRRVHLDPTISRFNRFGGVAET